MSKNANNSEKRIVKVGNEYHIVEGTKELRQRKNYSLPTETIDTVKAISKMLNCSESEAIVKIVDIIANDLVVADAPKEEPKKEETVKDIEVAITEEVKAEQTKPQKKETAKQKKEREAREKE